MDWFLYNNDLRHERVYQIQAQFPYSIQLKPKKIDPFLDSDSFNNCIPYFSSERSN